MKRISTNQSNEILSRNQNQQISQVSAELKTTPRRWRRTPAPRTRERRAMLCSQTKGTHNELFEAVEGLIHGVGCEDLTLRGRRLSQETEHEVLDGVALFLKTQKFNIIQKQQDRNVLAVT